MSDQEAALNEFDVLFDVRTAEFSSWIAFGPMVVLVAALVVELIRRRAELRTIFRVPTNPRMAVYLLAAVVLASMAGGLFRGYAEEQNEFVRVLDANQARTVEGVILNYTPQQWTGRPLEKFRVDTSLFSFDGFGASPAYHQRLRSGGPLREGMRVRVFEHRGNILRIEVVRSGSRNSWTP
jgi:hypothetical protein